MNDSDNAGCLSALIVIVYGAVWVGSGVLAWNWVEPRNFFGAILFLIAWGVIGYIGQIVGGLIVAVIAKL